MSSHFEIVDKINKATKETFKYPVSRTFKTDKGDIVEWHFRKLNQDEIERIAINCDNPISEKEQLFISCCEFPNLNDKRLQESYKVDNATDLLYKLIPVSEDWTKALKEVQDNVLGANVYELAETIKNEMCSNSCDISIMVRANALQELKILPSQYENLSLIDKAYILGVSMYKAKLLKKE